MRRVLVMSLYVVSIFHHLKEMSQQHTLSFPSVLSLDGSAPRRADCGILRYLAGKFKVEDSDYPESDIIGLEIERELVREVEMFCHNLRGSYVQDVLSIVPLEGGNKVVLLKSVGCSLSSYMDDNFDKLFVRESDYAYYDMSSLFILIVRYVVNALTSFHDRGFYFGRHLTCLEVRVIEKENQHPDIKFYPVGRVATPDGIKEDYDNIGLLIIKVQMRSDVLISHEIEDLVAMFQAGPNQGQLDWAVKQTRHQPAKIGDRLTSDVVVRLRTDEGRDHWFYCHSEILTKKSKYFAERLSNDWPTCQILDSRYCVEVYCQEPEFNFHVNALRLFYVPEPHTWHGVRNALGILQVAIHLGCPQMALACMEYLEAVPWEEAEEGEILRTIPSLGPQYEKILARLQPVDKTVVTEVFISAIRFAMPSPPSTLQELKSSAQEQIEYMLTEDDDAPLLALDDGVTKDEVSKCVKDLLTRFDSLVESIVDDLKSILCDISWVCQILNKMEMMKDLVNYWVDTSIKIVSGTDQLPSDTKLKVVKVSSKVGDCKSLASICTKNKAFGRSRKF